MCVCDSLVFSFRNRAYLNCKLLFLHLRICPASVSNVHMLYIYIEYHNCITSMSPTTSTVVRSMFAFGSIVLDMLNIILLALSPSVAPEGLILARQRQLLGFRSQSFHLRRRISAPMHGWECPLPSNCTVFLLSLGLLFRLQKNRHILGSSGARDFACLLILAPLICFFR